VLFMNLLEPGPTKMKTLLAIALVAAALVAQPAFAGGCFNTGTYNSSTLISSVKPIDSTRGWLIRECPRT
jgi:hypothetical protein